MREMVRFELDRHLPFPADDAAFDFLAVARRRGRPRRRHPARPRGRRRAARGGERPAHRRRGAPAPDLGDGGRARPPGAGARRPQAARGVGPPEPAGRRISSSWRAASSCSAAPRRHRRRRTGARRSREAMRVLRWRACDAIWLSGEGELAGTALLRSTRRCRPRPTRPGRSGCSRGPRTPRPDCRELAIAVAARRGARPLDLIPDERRPRRITRAQWATVEPAGGHCRARSVRPPLPRLPSQPTSGRHQRKDRGPHPAGACGRGRPAGTGAQAQAPGLASSRWRLRRCDRCPCSAS